MATFLVTGAAGGIGKATADRLVAMNHRVIRADLTGCDINADVGTVEGRAALIGATREIAPAGLDGIAAVAGVSHAPDPRTVVSVNYFGAIATLEGLRPLIAASPRPRATVALSTAALLPSPNDLVAACLSGNEAYARAVARDHPEAVYLASKRALAHWLRRTAVSRDWGQAGICLNGVGPGVTRTAMTEGLLATEDGMAILDRTTPRVTASIAEPADLAEVFVTLLTMETNQLLGQAIFVDGGTDCLLRPDAL